MRPNSSETHAALNFSLDFIEKMREHSSESFSLITVLDKDVQACAMKNLGKEVSAEEMQHFIFLCQFVDPREERYFPLLLSVITMKALMQD